MKAFTKRFACLALALVLMVCLMPDVILKAQATGLTSADLIKQAEEIAKAASGVSEIDMRLIWAEIELIGAKVALEQKITAGGLTGVALAQAKVILAQIQGKIAASGISAATCANAFAWAALAGIVIECTDWKNVWDAVFDKDQFFEERYITMASPISSFIVNYTNLDDKITGLLKAVDNTFYDGKAAWDYDYIETTNLGWQYINDWAKKTFGITENTPSGKTQTSPIAYTQYLSLLNCQYIEDFNVLGNNNKASIYKVPPGTYYRNNLGETAETWIDDMGRVNARIGYMYPKPNGQINWLHWVDDTVYRVWTSLQVWVFEKPVNDIDVWILPIRDYSSVGSGKYTRGSAIEATREELGLQSMPYTNNTPANTSQQGDWDDDEHIRFPMPPFKPNRTKTDEENLVDYIETFPKTPIVPQVVGDPAPEPTPEPSPEPSPQPSPNPDDGTDTDPDPDPEQTKKKLDFSPLMSIGGLTGIFPFCIPFDIARILTSFKAPSKEPIFYIKLPLLPNQKNVDLVLDFTVISPLMPMAKFFMWTLFVIGLMGATSKVIKW